MQFNAPLLCTAVKCDKFLCIIAKTDTKWNANSCLRSVSTKPLSCAWKNILMHWKMIGHGTDGDRHRCTHRKDRCTDTYQYVSFYRYVSFILLLLLFIDLFDFHRLYSSTHPTHLWRTLLRDPSAAPWGDECWSRFVSGRLNWRGIARTEFLHQKFLA